MDLLSRVMHIINESNCPLPVRDGCGILLPLPGMERGKKVTKTFSCPMSIRAPIFGRPIGRYVLDLEDGQLIRADPVDVFQRRDPVTLELDSPEFRRRILSYTDSYPRFFELAFCSEPDEETLSFCRESLQLLEDAMGEMADYYRWLSPELYEWLGMAHPDPQQCD